MNGPEAPHRRLRAWHAAHALALATYQATARWPSAERFGLTSQARRAAVSVELNLAEGASRRGPREFARHVSIALGSLAEVEACLGLAVDLGYLDAAEYSGLEAHRRTAGGLLWKLLASLNRACGRRTPTQA